jgi:plastocyanin
MKRILVIGLLCVMLLSLTGFAPMNPSSSTSQTYTVLVGSDNAKLGVSIMTFFPKKLVIHVGDTVVWKANSHEIHTVSFLAGAALPDFLLPAPKGMASPLMFNPLAALPMGPKNGQYDGTTYANSGIMSVDPGQVVTYSLTFTAKGAFQYVCIVHGMMMSAEIDVVDNSVKVLSPAQVNRLARIEVSRAWSQVPGVLAAAVKQVVPPIHHPDGTTTWKVITGYSSGVVDVMRFIPDRLLVKPGDTVEWDLSSADVAPHTVTFLNGNPDPSLVVPVPQPGGPPILLLNPAVLLPSQPVQSGTPLNKTGYFNSGLMNPAPQGPTSFSLTIGNISGGITYECLLHDTGGMVARLIVRP